MKKRVIFMRILVFTAIMSIGLLFLYTIHFIWVIPVLVLIGIAFGISGIPSQRLAPYPADAVVSFIDKIKGSLRNKI